jgi:hypothetical protein
MRDDFPIPVKELLAKRVAQRCSNPSCRKPTSGPQDNPERSINIGIAAHLTAASEGGPRFDPLLAPAQRASPENGIWMCQSCAKLVDNDEHRYTLEILRGWKIQAEQTAAGDLERPAGTPDAGGVTGGEELRLQLFDRRYAIYERISAFLTGIIQSGCVERGSDVEFLLKTKQAHFLFGGDPKIKALLDEIYKHAVLLDVLQAKEESLSGQLLEVNVDKQTDVQNWFQSTLTPLESRFDKYLRLAQ